MLPLYHSQQIRLIQQQALNQGLPLMQRAGDAAVQFLLQHPFKRFLIIVGTGNNGGDALVVATLLLQSGKEVYAWQPFASEMTADAKKAATDFLMIGQLHTLAPSDYDFDCIVDGLFGMGLNRLLTPEYISFIEQINRQMLPTLALDIPSGINADNGSLFGAAIRATWTLNYIAAKPGCYTSAAVDYCGQVFMHSLGIGDHLYPVPYCYLVNSMPSREALFRQRDAHKGLYGTVGIIGGTNGKQGSVILAGRSALQTGAGKVYIGFMSHDHPAIDFTFPDLMLYYAPDLLSHDIPFSILVVGPGLGTSLPSANILAQALDSSFMLVLDADALNLISLFPDLRDQLRMRQAQTLLTPHPAEAARLLQISTEEVQNQRIHYAKQLAQIMQSHVILKGAGSIYTDGDSVYINHSGNAALSIAGQGDILAGLIASLLAQHLPPSEAALLAIYIHGKAGDEWCKSYPWGIGLTASETILLIRQVLNQE